MSDVGLTKTYQNDLKFSDVPLTKEGVHVNAENIIHNRPLATKRENFNRHHHYLDKHYLRLFNSKTARAVSKQLDQKIESKFRYEVSPEGPWTFLDSYKRSQVGIMTHVLRFVSDFLWSFLVAPTLCILAICVPVGFFVTRLKGKNADLQKRENSKDDQLVESISFDNWHSNVYTSLLEERDDITRYFGEAHEKND